MWCKIAAICCYVFIAGMFGLPAIIWAIFLPSLKLGLPNPIPAYERILLETAIFCGNWKWLLALPVLALGGLLFNIAKLNPTHRGGKQQIRHG